MALSEVKVGLVGLGLVCESHIKAYRAHPKARVVAVCDLDEDRAGQIASKYGIPKTYTDYAQMLADTEIDTVDITTPTVLHAPMAIAAARAGKHILCEKPFCLTLAEGQAACDAADAADVTLMVGESYIFMTSIMKARALIDVGHIGRPLGSNAPAPMPPTAPSLTITAAGASIRPGRAGPATRGCSITASTSSPPPNT
jgi:predicted dehydrogenase